MRSLASLESELNKLRGYYNWELNPYAQSLMRQIDELRKYPIKNSIIIALEIEKGDEDAVYYGGVLSHYGYVNRYVKEYKNDKVKYTYDEEEAKRFTSDEEGTACMRACIKDGATHIVVWEYERNVQKFQCIHYPNEHWNQQFQPLLMHHDVKDYEENKY